MKILGRKTIAIILIILLSFMEFKFLHWYFFEIKEIEPIYVMKEEEKEKIIEFTFDRNNGLIKSQVVEQLEIFLKEQVGLKISKADIASNLVIIDINKDGYGEGDEVAFAIKKVKIKGVLVEKKEYSEIE